MHMVTFCLIHLPLPRITPNYGTRLKARAPRAFGSRLLTVLDRRVFVNGTVDTEEGEFFLLGAWRFNTRTPSVNHRQRREGVLLFLHDKGMVSTRITAWVKFYI